jgi:ribonuclease D
MPRGIVETRGHEVLDAVTRGLAVPDAELPGFPKAARWERDPDFDGRVMQLKAVRDAAAERLGLDPGVLCSRERMEAVARLNPRSIEALEAVPELRRWQISVLGESFVQALASDPASPYRPG